jgi:superoxide dismutase, Cu-Zn family
MVRALHDIASWNGGILMNRYSSLSLMTLALSTLVWASSSAAPLTPTSAGDEKGPSPVDRAVAVLHPTAGNQVKGTVHFSRQAGGIQVALHVEGLTPGKHGFHIHEFGDCSSPDGTSAGGHFNPFGAPHAGRDAAERHVGDLGNVTADDKGTAEGSYVDTHLALEGEASIIGRGVIVHGGEDDLKSQPSGAAGPRVGCGVVGIAK